MKRSTKNPWIGAGLVAGLAVAAALVLVWPSPGTLNQKAHVAAGVAAPANTRDACRLCQESRCTGALNACYPPNDGKPLTWPSRDAGGPPTPNAQAGCREVYECYRKTHCGQVDPGSCYCGEGVDGAKCFAGEVPPAGPCKELVEKQAGTKDPATIGLRYTDPSTPLGLAGYLHLCDITFCKDACK